MKWHTGTEASFLTPSHLLQPWCLLAYCSGTACFPSATGLIFTSAIPITSMYPLSSEPRPLLHTCKKLSSASAASNHTETASPLPQHPLQKAPLLLFPSCMVQTGRGLFSSASVRIIGKKFAALEYFCYIKYLHTYASHHFI